MNYAAFEYIYLHIYVCMGVCEVYGCDPYATGGNYPTVELDCAIHKQQPEAVKSCSGV